MNRLPDLEHIEVKPEVLGWDETQRYRITMIYKKDVGELEVTLEVTLCDPMDWPPPLP